MSNKSFRFKQFEVQHDLCAMKVGTDGVLLGAWTPLKDAHSILDVGTGSGLIALMCAQRVKNLDCSVVAIDIDEGAVSQANINIQNSPWKDRIEVVKTDFLSMNEDRKFDVIVCNPPFFVESLKCPDAARSMARHTDSLPLEELIGKASRLLTTNGLFSVVLPYDHYNLFVTAAISYGLSLSKLMLVHTVQGKAPKRVLMCFKKSKVDEPKEEHLVITGGDGKHTSDFIFLTRDFYLAY